MLIFNRFALNQACNFCNSTLVFSISTSIFVPDAKTLMSSAKSHGCSIVALAMSLT